MKKREQRLKSNNIAVRILLGAFSSILCTILLLFLSAVFTSAGVIEIQTAKKLAILSCVLGVLIGTLINVREIGQKRLLFGLGIGAVCFMSYWAAALIYANKCNGAVNWIPLLLTSLGAGTLAGLLGKRHKKRRR